MAHFAESTPMPTTGNTCRMEEEEENNHVTRTVVAVNFQQIMNEVKATTKIEGLRGCSVASAVGWDPTSWTLRSMRGFAGNQES